MSPLTLPKRLSIFSLGGATGGGSTSLRRMSTAKVSRSTDALDAPPSASVDGPSTPVALARSRGGGGLRSSFLSLFRPALGTSQRRPSQPLTPSFTAGGGPLTAAAAAASRGRRPSDCSADLYRSSAEDDEETSEEARWSGLASSVEDQTPPPALPRRPAHLLEVPSTPGMCGDRPLPLLPPIPTRQSSPFLRRVILHALCRLLHCVSKTSHLWLAIIFTYTVRLQQFLAKMLPRK